jgi:cystathionine beta-synthase
MRTPALFTLIGNTPLVEVTRLDTGPCQLFLKLESQNPGGSIKDRIGLSMIEAAENDGRLKPGGTIIEATAGNTGLGLALVGRLKGYRVLLVVPDKMSSEKVLHLKALGAEVLTTRSDVGKGHPEYYQDYAARVAAETPGAWFADQFNNPANPLAHETTTGPEIWEQMGHILADPKGSILAEYIATGRVSDTSGSWAVEGIGEDFIPAIADMTGVRQAYTITDQQSFDTARTLLREEGIPGGSSTGTLLAAALQYCREQTTPKRVVSFVCDTGTRYLSKVYNDGWMRDQGLLVRKPEHDLRDLIGRRHDAGEVISVSPEDTLMIAFNRMRAADVAQLPVLSGGKLVGIIDESDLLLTVDVQPQRFNNPVGATMTRRLEILSPAADLHALRATLDRGLTAVVADGDTFYGLITRYDLLNHLRRTLS